MTEFTMFLVYLALVAASIFLFRSAPDSLTRISMLLFACSFSIQAVMLFAAAFNGSDKELRFLFRLLRDFGTALLQAGVFVHVLRLLWKSWVRGPLRHS